MAWTSSAAQGACAPHVGEAARHFRSYAILHRFDAYGPGRLKLAALLHLALLLAAFPLGQEIAIAAVSVGGAITLLVLHREGTQVADGIRPAEQPNSHIVAVPAAPNRTQPPVTPPCDAAWTEIMGQISHELRTPLNAIIGFSDLMGHELHGPVGDPRYQEYLGHIRASGRSLLKSAEDTLALTELLANRGTEVARSTVDLEELLVAAAGRAGTASPGLSSASVSFDRAAARGIDVEGDHRALEQAVLNVLNEAQERAAGTGNITVSVRDGGGTAAIDICTRSSGPVAGTSLRLSLARMILELNGGSLEDAMSGPAADRLWRATISLDVVRQPDLFRH